MRVVLAEDHALLRDGLTRLLLANDFEIVAAVDNEPSLVRALKDPSADVAAGVAVVAAEPSQELLDVPPVDGQPALEPVAPAVGREPAARRDDARSGSVSRERPPGEATGQA